MRRWRGAPALRRRKRFPAAISDESGRHLRYCSRWRACVCACVCVCARACECVRNSRRTLTAQYKHRAVYRAAGRAPRRILSHAPHEQGAHAAPKMPRCRTQMHRAVSVYAWLSGWVGACACACVRARARVHTPLPLRLGLLRHGDLEHEGAAHAHVELARLGRRRERPRRRGVHVVARRQGEPQPVVELRPAAGISAAKR